MIRIESPSMALNDSKHQNNGFIKNYRMTYNWDFQPPGKWYYRKEIVEKVAAMARGAVVTGGIHRGKLRNLVINCHGSPAFLHLGPGFGMHEIPIFSAWAGLIDKIWITACRVAQIGERDVNNGEEFCSKLAKTVGCFLAVANEVQAGSFKTYPPNYIDAYEGEVLQINPAGTITSRFRSPSVTHNEKGLPVGNPW